MVGNDFRATTLTAADVIENAWVMRWSVVSSVLIGASRPEQVRENVASLEIELSAEQQVRLDAAGAPPPINPYFIFDLPRERISGGN